MYLVEVHTFVWLIDVSLLYLSFTRATEGFLPFSNFDLLSFKLKLPLDETLYINVRVPIVFFDIH